MGGSSHTRGGDVRGGESLEALRTQSQRGQHTHPAAAQLLDDTVMRDGLADHAWCHAILVGGGGHVNVVGLSRFGTRLAITDDLWVNLQVDAM